MRSGVARKPVQVTTSDGLSLTFWWWDQEAVRDKLLIVAPGFMQQHGTNIMRHLAHLFWHDRDVLGVDFRGMAGNPGRYSFGRDEHKDLRAAFEWAKRMGYKRVELIGFSMGAYICLRALAEGAGPVQRCYFVSGPTNIEEIVLTGGPIRQLWAFIRHPLRIQLRVWGGSQFFFRWAWPLGGHPHAARELAPKVKVPVHYLIGGDDQLVLPRLTRAVHDATKAPKSLTVFKDGQHAEYMPVTQPGKFIRWMREHGFKG
jgi:alpha-beta hydrolase superfamily lysophospholipase